MIGRLRGWPKPIPLSNDLSARNRQTGFFPKNQVAGSLKDRDVRLLNIS